MNWLQEHRRRFALVLGAGASALALGACGGSSHPAGTAADPATVVPASASVYVGAVVSPEGTLERNALSDARTLTHSKEPFAAIVQALASSGSLPHVDYDSEVKPWLGANVGLFVSSISAIEGLGATLGKSLSGGISLQTLLGAAEQGLLSAKGADGALVLDTSDLQAARTFIGKLAKREGAHAASFDGVTYQVDSAGDAAGIVGKFAVIGSEAGLRSVIETRAGGSPLSSSSAYSKLAAKSDPSATLLSVYLNAEAIATTAAGGSESEGGSGEATGAGSDASGASGSSAGGTSASGLLSVLPGEPRQVSLSVLPEAHALTVDVDLLTSAGTAKVASATAAASKLVGELPASSWLAIGVGEVGEHAAEYVGALSDLVSLAGKSLLASLGGPAVEALVQRLDSEPAALKQIFGGWAGAGGLFVAGNGLLDLEGGLVIDSSSAASSKAAVAKLGAALKAGGADVSPTSIAGAEAAETVKVTGLPLVLDIGAGNGRFALGLGPASVEAALSDEKPLAGSSLYEEATKSLGGTKPAIVLGFPTLVALIEGLGLNESPSLSGVMPSLDSLGSLVGGWQQPGGSVTRLQLHLGLAH